MQGRGIGRNLLTIVYKRLTTSHDLLPVAYDATSLAGKVTYYSLYIVCDEQSTPYSLYSVTPLVTTNLQLVDFIFVSNY